MPIPSPADFRNKSKKHSEVREMMAQMAESAESKDSATTKANAAKTEAIATAATDATTKANAAQAAAQADATTKANAAEENAKTHSDQNKLDLSTIFYKYVSGNLIGEKTKTVDNFGLNGSLNWVSGWNYSSKIIPVNGETLYLYNSSEIYAATSGYGFAFFDKDRSIDTSAVRITHTSTTKTDAITGKKYIETAVPTGANFLIINTRFTDQISWAIHIGSFSESTIQGSEYVSLINRAPIEKEISGTDAFAIQFGNTEVKELFRSSAVINNNYLNTSGNLVTTGAAHQVVRLKVKPGDIYAIKGVGYQSYPFGVYFSKSYSTINTTETLGKARLIATDQDDLFFVVAPANAQALFMNLKIVDGSNNLDLNSTLSIQKYRYKTDDAGVRETGLSSLSGNTFVDDAARASAFARDAVNINFLDRFRNKKVFAFGDSMTQGYNGGYLRYLESAFLTKVENYGSSGSMANRMVDIVTAGYGVPYRYNATVWPTKDYTDLKCAVLMIGTNDSSGANFGSIDTLPTGSVQDYENNLDYWALFPNDYVGNIGLCIEFIKWKAPNCEIYLVAPPPQQNATLGRSKIERLQQPLGDLAKYYGLKLINGTYDSGISYKQMRGDLNIYSEDGTHFNKAGNKVFGTFLARSILVG